MPPDPREEHGRDDAYAMRRFDEALHGSHTANAIGHQEGMRYDVGVTSIQCEARTGVT